MAYDQELLERAYHDTCDNCFSKYHMDCMTPFELGKIWCWKFKEYYERLKEGADNG